MVKNIFDCVFFSDNEVFEYVVWGFYGGGCLLIEGEVLRCVSSGLLLDDWEVGGFLVVLWCGRWRRKGCCKVVVWFESKGLVVGGFDCEKGVL